MVPILLVLAACGGKSAGTPDAASTAPDAAEPGTSLGTFQLTYYWVAYEGDFDGAVDTTLYTEGCDSLATVRGDFADALDIEGTGRLEDGRLINVDGACGCPRSPCYREADSDHPWGYGVQNRALVPFRSVAVDPDVIAYGTGLYLPALDGVAMPEPDAALVHDGCVVAADTGGGIVGAHVDFFVGLRDAYLALDGELALDELEVLDGGARCPSDP